MTEWISRNLGWLGIVLVALVLVVWVITGDGEAPEPGPPEPAGTVKVALTESRSEPVERLVTVQGHVEPEQTVRVRAKTHGEVVETPAEEGEVVESGDLIARLDMNDRQARLREAEAGLRQAEGDYEAAQQLADQGLQAELQARRARAELEAARARVAAIELDIEHTAVEAPIGGVLNRQIARLGDYVAAGEPVAEIVENDPLRAVVEIPQHRESEVAEGQSARVTFLDGQVRTGEVRYLSATADAQTRTFTARVRVDNPDRDLPAGTSVTVDIPVEEVQAHPVSPALVSQDGDGKLGVHVAVEEGGELRARFMPVNPVRADASRVWVTGLPERVRLISLGQGFVRDGDRIEVGEADTP